MITPSNGTTTAMTVHTPAPMLAPAAAFEPQSLPELYDLCNTLARSALIPLSLRGKPPDVAIVIMTGKELGLAPMQALRSIHVIQGRPVLSADLIVGLCKRSPVCRFFRLVASDAKAATYETQRDGEPEAVRLSYTYEQAQRAKLTGKENWQMHTEAMLRARCSSALARAVYPDLCGGLYDTDEGEEMRRHEQPQRQAQQASVRVVPTVEIAQAQPVTPTVVICDDEPAHDPDTGEVMDEQPAPVIAPAAAQPADGIGADLARLDACATMAEVLALGKDLVMRHKGAPEMGALNKAISAKQAALRNGGAK